CQHRHTARPETGVDEDTGELDGCRGVAGQHEGAAPGACGRQDDVGVRRDTRVDPQVRERPSESGGRQGDGRRRREYADPVRSHDAGQRRSDAVEQGVAAGHDRAPLARDLLEEIRKRGHERAGPRPGRSTEGLHQRELARRAVDGTGLLEDRPGRRGETGQSVGADPDDGDAHAHRGIRRHTGCGTSRATANMTRSCQGIQTTPARRSRTLPATTSATWSAVEENGAGAIPSVIRPMTKPGLGMTSVTPVPWRASAIPDANPSSPALAEPYTEFARRTRCPATEENATSTPRRRGFIVSASAVSSAAWATKSVWRMRAAAAGSRSATSWSPRT